MPVVDRLLDGRLRHILADQRQRGLTYAQMETEFGRIYGLGASRELIRRWCLALGIEQLGKRGTYRRGRRKAAS
jgi:hypothetical protein